MISYEQKFKAKKKKYTVTDQMTRRRWREDMIQEKLQFLVLINLDWVWSNNIIQQIQATYQSQNDIIYSYSMKIFLL